MAATASVIFSPVSHADETRIRNPGDALIEALENRSAVDRWILLRQEQRNQQSQGETPPLNRKRVSDPDQVLNGEFPELSKPFPEPGMRKPRLIQQRQVPENNEPERIAQGSVSIQVPKRRRSVVDNPDKLRKITDILPYHDYAPDTDSGVRNKTDAIREPEEKWTTKQYTPRKFDDVLYTWEATDLYHNPLYFEDPALERYGHTYPEFIQPFASVGRFGLQLFGLPYQMTIDPICSKHYTLGWYRPGECAPKLMYQIPLNARAAKVQAGVVTGLFFLIP